MKNRNTGQFAGTIHQILVYHETRTEDLTWTTQRI
jgi:hypothetical protein